jgi:ATP phosphoribosyltransferase
MAVPILMVLADAGAKRVVMQVATMMNVAAARNGEVRARAISMLRSPAVESHADSRPRDPRRQGPRRRSQRRIRNRVGIWAVTPVRLRPVLRLVIPKGSLEKATLQLFADADLAVVRASDVDYKATIDDPNVHEVRILRPQEIGRYVADGLFDIGITGRDWIEEPEVDVVTLGQLHYSKATARPTNIVVAVADDSPWKSVADLPDGVRVHTEYVGLTKRFFEAHGVNAAVSLSYGATEAKVPEIADAVVELTETGRALRAAGLKVIDTILVSYTELIANPVAYADPAKRRAMEQLHVLLSGALEARGRVLVKLNVEEANLQAVIALLPALKSPTVSKLYGEDGYAVETVIAKTGINTLIPALKEAGASGIIELPISKIVS